MTKRVIIMNFEMNAQAYQAFSEIKKLRSSEGLKGEQMAVVTHSKEGTHQFKMEDFVDFTGTNKSSKAGMIGMLIGLLGGPLGMMLGWFGGRMIGGNQDMQEIQKAQSIFTFVGNKIDEGETGLILIADEEDNRPINNLIMYELHGEVSRFDLEEVEEEIQKAKEVELSAKETAKKNWNEKHSEENEENNN